MLDATPTYIKGRIGLFLLCPEVLLRKNLWFKYTTGRRNLQDLLTIVRFSNANILQKNKAPNLIRALFGISSHLCRLFHLYRLYLSWLYLFRVELLSVKVHAGSYKPTLPDQHHATSCSCSQPLHCLHLMPSDQTSLRSDSKPCMP